MIKQLFWNQGERIEYIKPIMFSGGIGSIDDEYIKKQNPDAGMLVAKVGGPVYRYFGSLFFELWQHLNHFEY